MVRFDAPSPDGTSIAYAGCLKGTECPGESEVKILDLKTLRSRTVPGSTDYWSPRWSPDGKHLVALGRDGDHHALWLYSFAKGSWMKLASANHIFGWQEWSRDSKYVYSVGGNDDIIRINISNGRSELVLQMKDIPRTGWWGSWFGITPDEKILLLRSTGSEDLYAFDLQNR